MKLDKFPEGYVRVTSFDNDIKGHAHTFYVHKSTVGENKDGMIRPYMKVYQGGISTVQEWNDFLELMGATNADVYRDVDNINGITVIKRM